MRFFDRLLILTFVFVVSFSASVDVFHHDLSDFELESQECKFSNCQTSSTDDSPIFVNIILLKVFNNLYKDVHYFSKTRNSFFARGPPQNI